jgi:propanol-preferring alcohol dehydrogenase
MVELPEPEPAAGQVRLRVLTCGLCHTDLHTVEGDLELPKLPLVPGHQVVGIVDRLGEGVEGIAEGTRVGVPWLHRTCGTCPFCGRDEENLCDNAEFTGLHVDGGYAEQMVAPADFVYPLPERFDEVQVAPLLCAGIIGYRALRLSEVRPGEKLGLFGFGASAHVAIQVAIHRGIETYVFTRGEEHKRLAEELGAVWTGSAADNPPEPLDRAILFAPAGRLVVDMLRVLRKGGTASIASIYMSPIPEFDYGEYLYGERTLRSVTASTRQDARELLEVAAEIPVRTAVECFPLAEANEALIRLRDSTIRGAGVLRVSEP